MKILLCAEFFHPSVGGVQEVVKQIGLGLVGLGHEIMVATTSIESRSEAEFSGMNIASFRASGNLARGLSGEIDRYQAFVREERFDAILIYAAQQWTLDALLDILPDIKARKVLVPCGFSGFYLPEYQDYFNRLKHDLTYFDALVFHTRSYRDYEFAMALGLKNCVLIPNGASEEEFLRPPDSSSWRNRFGIATDACMLMTVGSLNGAKGHLEVARAITMLRTTRSVHVVLNGNAMPHSHKANKARLLNAINNLRARNVYQYARQLAWYGLRLVGLRKTHDQELRNLVASINKGAYGPNRRVLIVDLPRPELIQCYFSADLFVFASKIEYSPLVLFEAAAAGLPFLTTPVGNAREIADWTGAGHVCPSMVDKWGYTFVDTMALAEEIDRLIEDDDTRKTMGKTGRDAWQRKFTWRAIVANYEKVLLGCTIESNYSKGDCLE